MRKNTFTLLIIAAILTAGVIAAWQLTGGDYYTKFEVVEEVEVAIDESDPLAGTGFYGEEPQTKTVTRPTFRLGLLPTAQGLFDKHLLSVSSLLLPVWFLMGLLLVRGWIRAR